MKASEWVFLCAAHANPTPCNALSYAAHTIDSTIISLTRQASRTTIAEGTANKVLGNVARRMYRVFAHGWFCHRETFIEYEVTFITLNHNARI